MTEYNTAQKNIVQQTQFTIHTQSTYVIQQTKNTMQHKAYTGLNVLAVVQTQSTTYMAQCTGSSTNKMCDLQHITREDTMHYLHTAHYAQQNR